MSNEWKWVPVDPTREMLVAGLKTNGVVPIYAAMLAAAPAGQDVWRPLTASGQIHTGDWLCFTVGGKFICVQAREVLHPGLPNEEVIYNRKKNYFFVTSMAVDGTSSHKGVLVANTSKQSYGDHDDALDAPYQALPKVSDGPQPAASNPVEPGFREDQVLLERLTAENQRLWAVYHDQQDKRLAAEQKCDALSEQLAVANSLLNRVHGGGALSAEDHDAIGNYFVECSSADEPGGTVDRLQELLKRKQAEVVEEATKAIDAWREVTALRAQLAERNEVIPEACAECGATSTTGRKLFLYCGHCVGCLLTEVPSQPSPIEPDKKELVICTQDQSNPQTNTSQHAHCPHCAVCHTADEPCIDALRRVLALYEKRVLVPTGYCIMPTSLTAENGTRALLAGEFSFCQQHVCHECSLCSDESSDGCEICGGEGSYNQHSPVEWTLLKEIYQKAVAGLSLKPAP